MFTSISTLSLNGAINTHGGNFKFSLYLSNHSSVGHEFWTFGVFKMWPNNCLDSTCTRGCVKRTPTHTPRPSVCPPACRFPQSIGSLNQKWRASNCAADNDKWQDRQCTYNLTLRRVRANHCCSGKPVSVVYCECECVCVCVALGTQHAMRIRHIVICGPY